MVAGTSALLVSGCGHSRQVPATAAAIEEPVGPPAGIDLTGDWMIGSGPEPDAARITLNVPCLYHPAAWVLQQEGGSLEAYAFPESHDQGVAQREPLRRTIPARGKVSGVNVRLDDDSTHYRLRYDSLSNHLRGTMNGKPVWAVRRVVAYPGVCLPPA